MNTCHIAARRHRNGSLFNSQSTSKLHVARFPHGILENWYSVRLAFLYFVVKYGSRLHLFIISGVYVLMFRLLYELEKLNIWSRVIF